MQTIVRVNGRGNAWPVFVGGTHPFYENTSTDLANASYSLINFEGNDYLSGKIKWEILIDAGNHVAPFIIQHENRVPEALVITHGHTDHTLGIDWIAQSYYYQHGKKNKFPLYCSRLVWNIIKQSYPQLEAIIQFNELFPGQSTTVIEVPGLNLTAFPVFHGDSAWGASMLLFEYPGTRNVLFTGDMLCPLLRKKDYKTLSKAGMMFIDTNNRYPDPASGHTSIVRTLPNTNVLSPLLTEWLKIARLSHFLSMHACAKLIAPIHDYFDEFLTDWKSVSELSLCTLDFIEKTSIPKVNLVHYAGLADKRNYNEEVLTAQQLQQWANAQIQGSSKIKAVFNVPAVGDALSID